MSEADRKNAWEMTDDEFAKALESADHEGVGELLDELQEEHVRRYGIDRRLVRTDSAEVAELREMDGIVLNPGDHGPIELEYDEALELLDEAASLVLEMAEERARFTVPEFCPMCACQDATPVPAKEIDRDWAAVKHWLRDEFDIHITRKEAEHHYTEHVYSRDVTPISRIEGDRPTHRLHLPGEGVVEVEEADESPAARLEAMIERAEEAIDDSHLLDGEPTEVERDVVEALEFRETYTVSELAEASGRTRQSVYNNIDGLVESRVLIELGTTPATYEATGVCLYRGLEAPSPETGEQASLDDWVPEPETASVEDFL